MKKALSIMLMMLVIISSGYAESDEIKITLNGDLMIMAEPATIINGRTMVPVKFIFEPLGLEVKWDASRRAAIGQKEGLLIDMVIDQDQASVNGKTIKLDAAPLIINDRTYVPLRFVAESTGAEVTWHGDTRTVAIKYLPSMTIDALLKDIYADVHDGEGPDYSQVRQSYLTVRDKILKLKESYLSSESKMKADLIKLAGSCGLKLDEDLDLVEILDKLHDYKTKQHITLKDNITSQYTVHDFDNGDKYYGAVKDRQMTGLGYYEFEDEGQLIGSFEKNKRHGYMSEIHKDYYSYGYFTDNKKNGFEFSYHKLSSGYAYRMTNYKDGQRRGIAHQMTFDDHKSKLHDAYYTYKEDQSIGLEYVKYKEGFELFDRGHIDRDVVVQINPDGNFFIAPTNAEGIADNVFTGFAYTRFSNGVEYIGGFDDWSRLGNGMYFGLDDSNDITKNLMNQQAGEIIEDIIKDDMTETEKVKAIHDYLASHVKYDPNPIKENDFKDMSHTAYGALVDGVAVCDGYAEAFKYLMDKVKIDNVLIFGEVDEDGNFKGAVNHAWNLIELDGKYMHYDLTWNDDDANNRIVYTYYNKDSAFFDDTHKWKLDKYSNLLK